MLVVIYFPLLLTACTPQVYFVAMDLLFLDSLGEWSCVVCRSLLTLSTQLCSPLAGCPEPNARKEHQVLVKQRRVMAAVLQLVTMCAPGLASTGVQKALRG